VTVYKSSGRKIMEAIFFFIAAAGVSIQAIIGLVFFISCVWEKEPRATTYSGIQFLLMLGLVILLFYLNTIGFFETNTGSTFLILGLALAGGLCFFLMRKTEPNPRALNGTSGLILGEVKPTDERDIVFARNRTLRPGSEEYKAYYEMRPEFENFDATRRKQGGPLGHPGAIDRPHDRPNVAATLASLSIPLHLSQPEKFNPPAHPAFKGQRVVLNPGAASTRVKGYTLGIGANLVGICEINPLWIYSYRGEWCSPPKWPLNWWEPPPILPQPLPVWATMPRALILRPNWPRLSPILDIRRLLTICGIMMRFWFHWPSMPVWEKPVDWAI
jgi:hypothetical protein